MRTYVLRRLLQTIPLLFGISLITFLLLQLAPGDFLNQMAENPGISAETIEAMRVRFGLDKPWYVQYFIYLRNVIFHFDFGQSFARHQPVFDVIREGFTNTLLLAGAAALITWGLAIPLGVIAAVKQHSWIDRALSFLAFIWLSVPEILAGLLLLMLAARTGWFPVGGMRSLDYDDLDAVGQFFDVLHHLALPALVVGLIPLASRMRQMRGSLLDVLRLDYVTTARAKGLSERIVIVKHALAQRAQPDDHAVRLHAGRAGVGLVHRRDHLFVARPRADHARRHPDAGPVSRDGLGADGVARADRRQPHRRPASRHRRSADQL